jgi:hypothetical protein
MIRIPLSTEKCTFASWFGSTCLLSSKETEWKHLKYISPVNW